MSGDSWCRDAQARAAHLRRRQDQHQALLQRWPAERDRVRKWVVDFLLVDASAGQRRESTQRGDVVHKFIATCSTTLPGNTLKATFGDDEDRASQSYKINYENACKCHACSTTATRRSLSSMGNRYHQENYPAHVVQSLISVLLLLFAVHTCYRETDPYRQGCSSLRTDKARHPLHRRLFLLPLPQ